eukprot:scaffold648011_cov42-Prasinocladus_malaysianus.AAC.2
MLRRRGTEQTTPQDGIIPGLLRRHTVGEGLPAVLLPGQSAGTVQSVYKLGEVLGVGSFSVVRHAEHRKTGKKFACKVVSHNPPAARSREETTKLEDVAKEIQLVRALDHPHIMKIE